MNKIRLNEYKCKVMEALDGLDLDSIIQAAEMIASCEGIVWTFGNGQGLLVAEALSLDLRKHAGVKSVSFNSPALLAAYANDVKFDQVFSLQVTQMTMPHDVVIGFTFSGSPNIIEAILGAPCQNILITSNRTRHQIGIVVRIPSDDIQVVEDVWSSVCHMICNEVRMLKSGAQPEGD